MYVYDGRASDVDVGEVEELVVEEEDAKALVVSEGDSDDDEAEVIFTLGDVDDGSVLIVEGSEALTGKDNVSVEPSTSSDLLSRTKRWWARCGDRCTAATVARNNKRRERANIVLLSE